jgi:glycine/D-amino acid oxidase-like deaminating enzyme
VIVEYGRCRGVVIDKGEIRADVVVNAGGMYAPQIGRLHALAARAGVSWDQWCAANLRFTKGSPALAVLEALERERAAGG